VIVQLREGDMKFNMKFAEHLRDLGPAIDNTTSMVRRTLPLHRQLKSFYQQNRILRKENKPQENLATGGDWKERQN
jgi:hypothetical protein